MSKKGFTVIEILASFSIALTILIVLFNVVIIMKDNLGKVNAMTNTLVEKDNLSYNINKKLREKGLASLTVCSEGDKCYLFTYNDSTSDKLVYSNADKTITFNNYTFDITDDMIVEAPIITEHYDTMSSTSYNGYFILNIPITVDNKDYSIKLVKHFNTDSTIVDVGNYWDNQNNKYTMVNYLESTGTQYVNTQYYVKSNTRVEMNMQLIYTDRDQKFLGSYGGGGLCLGTYASKWRFGSNTWNKNEGVVTLDKTYITIEGNTFTFNDEVYTLSGTNRISDNNLYPVLVFGIAYAGSAYQKDSIKLYDLKLYDSDTLVRDFVPVIDSSSRPCLFDKVGKECYYNQGTGEFLWG